MSKAFTRESDDGPDESLPVRQVSALPPGAKNYMTAGGAAQLRTELEELAAQREALNALPEGAEKQSRLQLLSRKVATIQQILQSVTVPPAPPQPWDRVLFGATVTVRERKGEETRYRIVGVDETDLDRDWVSWISPIGKALLNAPLGGVVKFKFPSGQAELEIVGITYE